MFSLQEAMRRSGLALAVLLFWMSADQGWAVCEGGVPDGAFNPGAGEECDDDNLIDCDGCHSDCTIEIGCGDNFICGTEVCDDGNAVDADGCSADCLSDESCGNNVTDTAVGEGCDDGDAISNGEGFCVADCSALQICGDTVTNGTEGCDDGDAISNGEGSCVADCSALQICGDTVTNGTEACDDGDTISNGEGFCVADCSATQICGDGAIDGTEECDDANANDNDDCLNGCLNATCGDGIVWNMGTGTEPCDDGNDGNPNNDCLDGCVAPTCGDGFVWNLGAGTEECDDANANDNDDCLSGCVNATCGDGIVWNMGTGTEPCDDGNDGNPNNDCLDGCIAASCGDSFVWNQESGTEECDDGNDGNPNNDCLDGCVAPTCGDGFVWNMGAGTEQCDDANANNNDDCLDTCANASCGDGFVWNMGTGTEPCDDGNDGNPNNDCLDGCIAASCGDSFVWNQESGVEGCDDGGNADCDGCKGDCSRFDDICGDGIPECAEACDDGANNDAGEGFCADGCIHVQICQNGSVEGTEACDDANPTDCDGCHADCTLETGCGDAHVCDAEICDDGPGEAEGLCTDVCDGIQLCGNGVRQGSEACDVLRCDDGSICLNEADCAASGSANCLQRACDGCALDCARPDDVCGDAIVECGESCDDGNLQSCDGCRNDCSRPDDVCGDAITECNEFCDDGNAAPCDGCSADCLRWDDVCGDGIAECAEVCDDGNVSDCDGCKGDCTRPDDVCGDSIIDGACGEDCDDGGFLPADGCDAVCRWEICGNGVVGFHDPGGGYVLEYCDDGNLIPGDGCDGACLVEPTALITASPAAGVEVFLDGTASYPGEYLGTTDGFQPVSVSNLSPGVHRFELRAVGHKPLILNPYLIRPIETLQGTLLRAVIENFTEVRPVQAASIPIDVGDDASVHLVDWDCNGATDLLTGNATGEVLFFANDSARSLDLAAGVAVEYDQPTPTPVQVGGASHPFVVDWNNDGALDLLVGGADGRVSLYAGTGGCPPDLAPPVYLQADGADLTVGGDAAPFVADIDGDRKKDLVAGDLTGAIVLFHNMGDDDAPSLTHQGALLAPTGAAVHPAFYDVDADGVLDLLLNNDNGSFDVRRGARGPGGLPVYDLIPIPIQLNVRSTFFDPALGVGITGAWADVFFDINYGGDLFVGKQDGTVALLQNIHIEGEISGDYYVNGQDVFAVNLSLGTAAGEPYYNPNSDLPDPSLILAGDLDGAIDLNDRDKLEEEFGTDYGLSFCGNRRLDTGEECDDGGACSDNGAPCRIDLSECADPPTAVCQSPSSGWGTCSDNGAACRLDLADCADPFAASCIVAGGDGCSATCLAECGNGAVDGASGEECDDGNQVNGDGCDDQCFMEICGNGRRQIGEQCDDGNLVGGDGCGPTCRGECPSFYDSFPFVFENIFAIGTDTGLTKDDEATLAAIGFDFPYGESVYSNVYVSSNGFLTFDATGNQEFANTTLPDPTPPNNLIAAFWDDLTFAPGGTIKTLQSGVFPSRRWIVQWTDLTHVSSPTDRYTFQAILHETTGMIEFNYLSMSGSFGSGNSATVGAESALGTDGRLYSFNASNIYGGLSRRFQAGGYCAAACGNNILEFGELCDDGNRLGCDGCSALCQIEPVPACGNGVIECGEGCDDANADECDGCRSDCSAAPPTCGDGVLCGLEACDDGGSNGSCGFCASDCSRPVGVCGDGIWDFMCGEECDDGGTDACDGCDAVCAREFDICGDGVIDCNEECDDSNINPGDGCGADCLIECPAPLFLDDMESGAGSWRIVDSSGTGMWHITATDSTSPTQSWWLGAEGTGTYDAGVRVNEALDTPLLALVEPTVLGFWEKYYTEGFGYDPKTIQVLDAADAVLETLRIDSTPDRDSGGWLYREYDLSAYQGQTIRIRFWLDTVDDQFNAYLGWLIDDVVVVKSGCQ